MNQFVMIFKLGVLVLIGFVAWLLFANLTESAIAMMLGILFGAFASTLVGGLVLIATRSQIERRHHEDEYRHEPRRQLPQPTQPPIIIITGPPQRYLPPGTAGDRGSFQVVESDCDWR